jgi:hypothetical protein
MSAFDGVGMVPVLILSLVWLIGINKEFVDDGSEDVGVMSERTPEGVKGSNTDDDEDDNEESSEDMDDGDSKSVAVEGAAVGVAPIRRDPGTIDGGVNVWW